VGLDLYVHSDQHPMERIDSEKSLEDVHVFQQRRLVGSGGQLNVGRHCVGM
jgi:hypothetical protein